MCVLLKNQAKEVYEWLQDLEDWQASLAMQFANNMLLFNGVNQISANGMKGKTSRKADKAGRTGWLTELLE